MKRKKKKNNIKNNLMVVLFLSVAVLVSVLFLNKTNIFIKASVTQLSGEADIYCRRANNQVMTFSNAKFTVSDGTYADTDGKLDGWRVDVYRDGNSDFIITTGNNFDPDSLDFSALSLTDKGVSGSKVSNYDIEEIISFVLQHQLETQSTLFKKEKVEYWSENLYKFFAKDGPYLPCSLINLQEDSPQYMFEKQRIQRMSGAGSSSESSFTCGDDLTYLAQTYATVEIGSQCWMQENLNVGTCVTGTTEQASTGSATGAGCDGSDVNQVQIEKYCYNDNEDNCYSDDGDDTNDYGGLYQWDEAMDYSNIVGAQGICPDDWHIPTDAEWHTLESGLATESCDADRLGWACNPAGTELKSTASNSFKGLLAGFRHTNGLFDDSGSRGNFWSSLGSGSDAWRRDLLSSGAAVLRYTNSKAYGFSVRCVKD